MSTSVSMVRSAIESSLGQHAKCNYLSHPITTGGRSIDANVERAARISERLRSTQARHDPLVNPASIGHIPGWDQYDWMCLWLPFIRDRVKLVFAASDWESSEGCTMEVESARGWDIHVVYLIGD